MLVKYWDKYTEMHGQQNVKISSSCFLTKLRMHIFCPPHVLYAPTISLFMLLSPEWYMARSTASQVFVTQSSPFPWYHVPLKPKYPPQYTFLERHQPTFLHQVSHPYKTRSKIIFLCILIFMFMESKMEDKRYCTNDSKHSLTRVLFVSSWLEFWVC